MSCAGWDIRGYFLEEATAQERQAAEAHLAACSGCRDELERLRVTGAALMALRDEDVPRRIAFVSDKVFEPRWWQCMWDWPKVAFASAAMLSAAIVTHAVWPAPVLHPAPVRTADVSVVVKQAVDAAVARAVMEADARHEQRAARMLAAAERTFAERQRETVAMMEANLEVLTKKVNNYYKLAADYGGGR